MRTLSFSHDGKMLASASEDHFIDIAEVETGNGFILGNSKEGGNWVEKCWWSWEDTGRIRLIRKSFAVQSKLP